MPLIKSAIKRVRQEQKRRSRNLAAKRRIRIATKQTQASLVAKDVDAAQKALIEAISQIDKAVKKGTLHRNTGNRRKSSLTRSFNAIAPQAHGTGQTSKAKTPTATTTKKKPAAKKTPAAKK